MLTRATAQALAGAHITSLHAGVSEDDELVIVEESTLEREWGWVFFYTSRLWRCTGEVRYALAGNGPLLVEKEKGVLHALGTGRSLESQLAAFERTGTPRAEQE